MIKRRAHRLGDDAVASATSACLLNCGVPANDLSILDWPLAFVLGMDLGIGFVNYLFHE